MAQQAEQAFAKTFLSTISTQPIAFSDDYQQPLQNWLKRVPILPIPLPSPPSRGSPENATASTSSSAPISITFKSLKPPVSYTISVQPTDSIASIKSQLADQTSAPPADSQRLLLKGKALADSKLLQEYSVKDGDTVNLVVKPGFDWDPSKPKIASPTPVSGSAMSTGNRPEGLDLGSTSSGRKGHTRIPSVVLSPSPSHESPGAPEKDILLTLDRIPSPVQPEDTSTFGVSIANPEFWQRLHAFLKAEFTTESDALLAFENFFRASKGSLTPNQIAKIRDTVGIVGMAGK